MVVKIKEGKVIFPQPVVEDVEAIKIRVMKWKHFEQLPSAEFKTRHLQLLGLATNDWLLFRDPMNNHISKAKMIVYVEWLLSQEKDVKDKKERWNELTDLVTKNLPQVFIEGAPR